MRHGCVVIVSGPPGAGKTTVSRLLAQHSPAERSVHLHSDDYYARILKGFIAPWRAEAHHQNVAITEAVTASAASYARGGYEVIVDGVFGPWLLEPWGALSASGVDVRYVVLRADQHTTLLRAVSRRAPGALIDPEVIRTMWQKFAELGHYEAHALVSTAHTAAETATLLRRALDAGSHRLAATATAR
jgi:predicted kinase